MSDHPLKPNYQLGKHRFSPDTSFRRCVCCWGLSPLQPRLPLAGAARNPVFSINWAPALAGVTTYSAFPKVILS